MPKRPAVDTELEEQCRRFEPVLQISPSAIVVTDLNATVAAWNAAAEKLFGYTAEEAIGRNLDSLVAKNEELHAEAVRFSERAPLEQFQAIARRTRKDGTLVDVNLQVSPVVVDGRSIGAFSIYHDITEIGRDQQRFMEALVEVSPEAIVTTDMEDIVRSWNPAAERLFGYTAVEAIGRHVDDLVCAREDLRAEGEKLDRLANQGQAVQAVTQRTRKDGSLVDVDVVGGPVSVRGEIVAKHVIYHDITELQQQKRYFESLLEISPAAIVVTDLESKIVSWNPAAQKLFGYSSEEAVGRNLDDLVATRPELHREAVGFSRKSAGGEHVMAFAQRTRKDGSLVDVQLVSAPVFVAEERIGFLAMYVDVSEIQRQRRYYEALVESSPVAIALLDPDGTVHSWNPAAERLFGYPAGEAVGRNIDDLVATAPEVRGEADAQTRQGMGGDLVHAISRRTHRDGTFVDVEIFGAPVTVGGEPAGLYAMYHDITELQRAREAAEAATQAKSVFLATMSHEIRTPLNAVIGMTGLLLDTALDAEQRNFAEVIRNSGDALLGVINDILDFSKMEAGRLDLEQAPFVLRECVESAFELVAAGAVKKGLDLAYDIDPQAPGAVVGDVTRLRQILINLLNNAVKFTEQGEVVVTVTTEPVEAGDRHRLHFAVRDTGIGIAADRMDRLFASFSQVDPSTTRRYGGSGLGLAISKRLAEMMGGSMWAESTEGEGSTFHFTIVGEAAPAPVRAFERAEAPQLTGRRVLIVDDNATNRQILARQTTSWGMLARETGVPAEALEWVRRGDPLDVGILDMQMPDMDGVTLAAEIRRHRSPDALPLVMLTSLGGIEELPAETSFAAYLTKPIKPSQLFDTLSDVFGVQPEHAHPRAPAETDEHLAERLPLRILVVEDNAVNQQLATLLLQKLGYRADVAANGVEGLEALERQPYDVVLMDVEMPEMDGLEATRRIHQRWSREQRPHIIAVTANAMEGERETVLAAGMDDYLAKPIRMEELSSALARGAEATRRSALDPDVLANLTASFGEDGGEAVAGLIDTFLESVPDQTATLRRAVDEPNPDEVRRVAHTLKSNAATFGAVALAEVSRELENRATTGALEGAPELTARIEAELGRVEPLLRSARKDLAS